MSRIIIFEGVDGSGKSTAAKACATQLNARYVHFGPLPGVKKAGARLYVEAVLPALLGYQDVVLDRCWVSEGPYGKVYRGGADRIGPEQARMLDRIFSRCQTTFVLCDPGWDAVKASFVRRKGEEYLDNLDQLKEVYQAYEGKLATTLPCHYYNYVTDGAFHFRHISEDTKTLAHELGTETAGNRRAHKLIVGESYANLMDADPLYQKPFCAFSGAGCSRWLTQQLIQAGVQEYMLGWVNADHLSEAHQFEHVTQVIALGQVALEACLKFSWPQAHAKVIQHVPHPQAHKRFHASEPYALQELLK